VCTPILLLIYGSTSMYYMYHSIRLNMRLLYTWPSVAHRYVRVVTITAPIGTQRSRDSEQEYVYTQANTAGAQQKTNVPSPPLRYFLYYNPPPPRIYSIAECTFPPVARRARTFCEALVKPMSCNCYESKYMSIQERAA
jgi:hypothetical protein